MMLEKILADLDSVRCLLTSEEYDTVSGILKGAIDRSTKRDTPDGVQSEAQNVSETSVEDEIRNMEEAERLRLEGTELFRQGRYADAEKKYSLAIEKDPMNKVLYSNRSACFAKLNMCEEGIRDAEKAIEIDPGYAKAYSRLGTFYYYSNPEKSLEYYTKAQELDRTNQDYEKMVVDLKRRVGCTETCNEQDGDGKMDIDSILKNPELMNYAKELLKNKSPEEINQMKEMFGSFMKNRKS